MSRAARLAADVNQAAAMAADLSERVAKSYQASANFDLLNNTSAVRDGVIPTALLDRNGTPRDPWGGSVQLAGVPEGFAVTFEQVPPGACARFVAAAARTFDQVKINNADYMPTTRLDLNGLTAICALSPPAGAVVQFWTIRRRGGTNPELVRCLPAPPETQPAKCPGGQIASVPPYSVYGREQRRTAFCNMAYGVMGWTPWTDVSNTCAPACSPPAPKATPMTQWVNRSAACPSGQTGSHTWQAQQSRTATTTYSCPAPTGPYITNPVTYSAWKDTGTKRNEANTCKASHTYKWRLVDSQSYDGHGGDGPSYYVCSWGRPSESDIDEDFDPGVCSSAYVGKRYYCSMLIPASHDDLQDDTFECQ
jgi:hypothetical protein